MISYLEVMTVCEVAGIVLEPLSRRIWGFGGRWPPVG